MVSSQGKKFSEALLESLEEKTLESIDRTATHLERLVDLLNEFPELQTVIRGGLISLDEQQELFSEICKRLDTGEPVRSFIMVLLEARSLHLLDEILVQFRHSGDEFLGRIKVSVRSAAPLKEEEISALVKKIERLTGKSVYLDYEVETELLGGIITRVGDMILDGSIRNRLNQFRSLIGSA